MNNISQFDNPYLAPQTLATTPPPLPVADAEAIRREHAYTESTIKTLGILYYLAGSLVTLGGLLQLPGLLSGLSSNPDPFKDVMLCATITVFGVVVFAVGREARKFSSSARTAILFLSVLGLFAVPIGTLISIYIICMVAGKKGSMVFSPEYRAIMATTTRQKVKTSPAVWAILIIAALIIAVAVFLIFTY